MMVGLGHLITSGPVQLFSGAGLIAQQAAAFRSLPRQASELQGRKESLGSKGLLMIWLMIWLIHPPSSFPYEKEGVDPI